MDPYILLPVSNVEDDKERIDSGGLSTGQNGMLMNPALPSSVVALPAFDVGNGVVMIVIAIVLGTITAAIAWIVSPVS